MVASDEHVRALTIRVEKLEIQNRRWRLGSIGLLLGVTALAIVGAAHSDAVDPSVIQAKTVEATNFVLKDDSGRVRGRMSIATDTILKDGKVYHIWRPNVTVGQALLEFYDEDGNQVWVAPKIPTVQPLK
jgi:hypothetical protein